MGFFQSGRSFRLNPSISSSSASTGNRAFFRNSFRSKATTNEKSLPMTPKATSTKATESSDSFTKTKILDISISPKEFLANLLQSRGYTVQTHDAISSGYCQPASPLQIACCTDYVVTLVKNDNADALRELLATDFISLNPTNIYGESMASLACRFGSIHTLQMMIREFRVNVSTADSYGRTCLHEACWNARIHWPLVELLLDSDPQLLFVMDRNGRLPLDYCQSNPEITNGWIELIDRKKDEYWPIDSQTNQMVPPHTRPMASSTFDCMDFDLESIEHAKLVASGNMHPDQITKMFRLGTSLDELEIEDIAYYTSGDDDTDGTENIAHSRSSFNFDMLEPELSEFLDVLDHNVRQMYVKSQSSKHLLTVSRFGDDDDHHRKPQLRRGTLNF